MAAADVVVSFLVAVMIWVVASQLFFAAPRRPRRDSSEDPQPQTTARQSESRRPAATHPLTTTAPQRRPPHPTIQLDRAERIRLMERLQAALLAPKVRATFRRVK